MSKHTPGPWTYNQYTLTAEEISEANRVGLRVPLALTNNGEAFVKDEQGLTIALVRPRVDFKRGEGHKVECSERDSNAKLISAAPELLSALQSAIAFLDQMMIGDGRLRITPQEFGEWTLKASSAIAKATGEKA